MTSIKRINYRNPKKQSHDFEIVDLQLFFATRPHWHISSDYRLNFWLMIYIYEGSGQHSVDFEDYTYNPGDLVVIQKNQVHHFIVNKNAKGYLMHINEPFFMAGDLADLFLDFFDRPYKSPIISVNTSESATHRILMDLIYKEYLKTDEQQGEELIRALFKSFLLAVRGEAIAREASYDSKVLNNYNVFRKLLDEHFQEEKTVEAYAAMMNVTKKVINYATRQVVGMSAKQFIIQRTLLEIKRYLSQGELMNYEISDLMGFDEPANMTKFFKRYEGISPKAFRKKCEMK